MIAAPVVEAAGVVVAVEVVVMEGDEVVQTQECGHERMLHHLMEQSRLRS